MDDAAQWDWPRAQAGPGYYRVPVVARQLAESVSAYRAARGLTQADLGAVMGLPQSQVARLEAGGHTPSLETLSRLAKHLGVTVRIEVTPEGATLTLDPPPGAVHAAG